MKNNILFNEKSNIIGFKNINGFTCYINSIINILYQSCYLQKFILTNGKFGNSNIFEYVLELFETAANNPDCTIEPVKFIYQLGKVNQIWNSKTQQDSQEFLIFIIDNLIENTKCNNGIDDYTDTIILSNNDTNKYSIFTNNRICDIDKKNNSYIFNLFNIYYQTIIKCKHCDHININVEQCNTLLLNIPLDAKNKDKVITIYDCLDHYFFIESVNKNCDICGNADIIHYKKSLIWKSSNILIICFIRFLTIYDEKTTAITNKKINDYISYPLRLDIHKYYNTDSQYANNRSIYDLYAINLHISNSNEITSGHYTSMINTLNTSTWLSYNDDSITKINNLDELQNKNAYILFYKRCI